MRYISGRERYARFFGVWGSTYVMSTCRQTFCVHQTYLFISGRETLHVFDFGLDVFDSGAVSGVAFA
jgi:hypothetical protein